ncbi:MAG: hypothetical protein IJK70_05930 [Bacteroidales bacterium]|nr:hypothetical protein [Bacteroidales bacterium]
MRLLQAFFSILLAMIPLTGHGQELVDVFNNIPNQYKPQVWWHWMDGNVSREGIRKDLEWMRRSGIGGVHQFDAGGINMPRAAKVKLPYLSEGWKDAFGYAVSLADSCGMDVTIASAPGWSSTGGTWVTPTDAVKKLEWRSVDLDGGNVDVSLPELYRVTGPYQDFFQGNDRVEIKPYGEDLFVLAVRRSPSDRSMEEMGAEVEVSDTLITVKLNRRYSIKSFTLKSMSMGGRPREGEPDWRNILECSDDGVSWKEIHKVSPSRLPYMTEDINPVKARWFRVRGEKLESLDLFTVRRVNHSEELGGFSNVPDFNRFHIPARRGFLARRDFVKREDVLDLTGKMTPEGRLSCSLPKGRWRVYRFGWSITGKVNHPASPEATGLEVDKLDKEAWMRYFHHYLDLYKEVSGNQLGAKGIRYLLTDSYEAGSFTWTPCLVREFKNRRGYDPLPWLPVLTGEVIGGPEESEGFLWDWRKTLGELFSENYQRIKDLVDEYGLAGNYCETHEGGRAYVGDGMDPKLSASIPMAAIWMENTPTGSSVPSAVADIRESASAAHISGSGVVAAESFSVNGDEGRAYTYCPENMKYVADVALSAGVNRFVIHESASQPNDAYLPGLQLFRYGQWFHRNETWGDYAWVLMDYLGRSSALMRQGIPVADILLYYGEDSNVTSLYGGDSFASLPQVPAGYEYDFANPTVLKSYLRPDALRSSPGGTVTQLESVGGTSYEVLWLDGNVRTMSLDMLQKIKEYADAGVRICGHAPERPAGLNADKKAFRRIVKDIWESGRENVYGSLDKALEGIAPDCVAEFDGVPASPEEFRYVHRSMEDGTQIYWVRNFSGKYAIARISFRDAGPYAALFNHENGKIFTLNTFQQDGRTLADLPMLSSDAFFVVFSPHPFPYHALSSCHPERSEGSRSEGSLLTIPGPWKVSFNQKGGDRAEEIFPSLKSWTESGNPVVKYYSGTAIYNTTFVWKPDTGDVSEPIFIDLGSVKNIAEVFVNGEKAGVLWKAPFRTEDISGLLRPGKNSLEIRVTNLWRNRMIGDVQLGETRPVTAIRRFYKAGDSLLPSGLLGPVVITR